MKVFSSFVAVGLICAIASIIYDTTKLTPGHITSLFVVVGAILGIFGFYDVLTDNFGYGLSLPITSFGNALLKGAYDGFHESGFFGIFSGILTTTSAGISITIIGSFIMTIFSKVKD